MFVLELSSQLRFADGVHEILRRTKIMFQGKAVACSILGTFKLNLGADHFILRRGGGG